jgi:dTDP-4-dehydrorhamnose 3,5-epimerase
MTTVCEFTVASTAIDGLWQLSPRSATDERGTVREFFRTSAFRAAGLPVPGQWQQVNLTSSVPGAVRGLHGEPMTKLIGVAAGAALGAYLDARELSPTYGTVVTIELTVGVQVLVPNGVCNGFQALGPDGCQYLYCFDAEWSPGVAGVAVNPLDPALGIDWRLPPTVSPKDAAAPRFAELAARR